MASKITGLSDLHYVVWAEGPIGEKFYAHGKTIPEDRMAVCPSIAHVEVVLNDMRVRFPGANLFVCQSIAKHPCKVETMPLLHINDKGEVFP